MSDTDLDDLPRGIALAWGVAASPQRGPKREMSVERIVEAAVELADAEGLGAVSMAAVASRLGYTPMSLYRYISAKDDLILLMQEAAVGAPGPITGEGWRERAIAFHDALLSAYLAHPWAIEIPIAGISPTPGTAAWMDAGIQVFDDTPFDDDERLSLMLMLTGYAHWYAMAVAGMTRRAAETGSDYDAVGHESDGLLARLVTADEYPSLHRAIAAGVLSSGSDPFRFGLDRIIDGIAAHLEALAVGTAAAPSRGPLPEAPEVASDRRVRETRKKVREAEKLLRAAHKEERAALREARERARQRQAKDAAGS
ncbi:TetR family transcriptional regulator [Microbacterium mangrovi]|uniref:TetR family transcriptional regulator n=1 Tax=Microbacterium mangrovi TaxID=1348253 RepID=A0A0B2A1C5_9MICO|nr:TetR/AcrR family transcriptional regulator [Microbacterium mangrovi]KHK95624.1 TetR family transcriptional regulator [Microbacterium mangrovi]